MPSSMVLDALLLCLCRRNLGRSVHQHPDSINRLRALEFFTPYWQPTHLRITDSSGNASPTTSPRAWRSQGPSGSPAAAAPAPSSPPLLEPALCSLQMVSSQLHHMELSCPHVRQLHWLCPITGLRCLSLRGCHGLEPAALQVRPG